VSVADAWRREAFSKNAGRRFRDPFVNDNREMRESGRLGFGPTRTTALPVIRKWVARPTGLDHRFAEQREARGDLETAAGAVR